MYTHYNKNPCANKKQILIYVLKLVRFYLIILKQWLRLAKNSIHFSIKHKSEQKTALKMKSLGPLYKESINKMNFFDEVVDFLK